MGFFSASKEGKFQFLWFLFLVFQRKFRESPSVQQSKRVRVPNTCHTPKWLQITRNVRNSLPLKNHCLVQMILSFLAKNPIPTWKISQSGHHTSRPFFFGRYPTVGTSKSWLAQAEESRVASRFWIFGIFCDLNVEPFQKWDPKLGLMKGNHAIYKPLPSYLGRSQASLEKTSLFFLTRTPL